MAIEKEPGSDENDDRVSIKFANDEVRIVERYSFQSSILQQPAAFAVSLSGARDVAAILARYPARTRCALYIGKYRQFTGEIDAVNVSGDAMQTTVDMRGRDLMARLHDQDIEADRSFDNATYEELFKAALQDVGQGDKIVEISNTANRQIRVGRGVKITAESVEKDEPKKFQSVVTAKLGETWLHFLERHFKRIGLFPWCDANGNFVLSRPNADQEPLFHFYRTTPQQRADVAAIRGVQTPSGRLTNVTRFAFTNDTAHRFAEVVVFARNHGRKSGHNHTHGGFVDEEMTALGFDRRRVFRDVDTNTEEDAIYFARRRIAEVNRAGWKLQYTVSGHTATTVKGVQQARQGNGGLERAIITPDTLARIDDDDLDIHDVMYIESVEHRSPPRETVITLIRVQDLLFGDKQAESGAKKAKVAAKTAEDKRKKQRDELDILGLRTGTYGYIDPSSATNKAVEAARAKAEAIQKKAGVESFDNNSLQVQTDALRVETTFKVFK